MASTTLILYDRKHTNYRSEAGVLEIATGNFASERYTDEKGKEARRAAAGLWLVVRGRPDTSAFTQVHAGQQIDFEECRIRVRTVGSDYRGMYVKIDVENPK
jgi:hypothetical protein